MTKKKDYYKVTIGADYHCGASEIETFDTEKEVYAFCEKFFAEQVVNNTGAYIEDIELVSCSVREDILPNILRERIILLADEIREETKRQMEEEYTLSQARAETERYSMYLQLKEIYEVRAREAQRQDVKQGNGEA